MAGECASVADSRARDMPWRGETDSARDRPDVVLEGKTTGRSSVSIWDMAEGEVRVHQEQPQTLADRASREHTLTGARVHGW